MPRDLWEVSVLVELEPEEAVRLRTELRTGWLERRLGGAVQDLAAAPLVKVVGARLEQARPRRG